MFPLRLYLFGAPRLEKKGDIVSIRRRKAMALLAYLAVTGQPQGRDALATLFWPEHDTSGARANLRRDLSRLKHDLGDDVLLIDRMQVSLNPEVELWLDVGVFETNLAQVQAHDHTPQQLCTGCLEALAEAVALYTDDFLAGFSLPDSAAFDEWQFFQAESLRHALAEALQQLIGWHIYQEEFERGIEYGRLWLSLDSLHEPAHRRLMQLYAWAGQQAAALRQYQECVTLLQEELGVAPEPETVSLYERIHARQLPPPDSVEETPPGELPPQDRYVVEELLAVGGHGEVHRGRDRLSDQPVVIKRLRPEVMQKDPQFVARFEREGETLRRLNHPNIVKMLATIEEGEQRCIVMEYVPGGTLRHLLDREPHLPLARVLDITLELADALTRAHHLNIIHRDLKPDNVLLASDGTPRLTDFGVARLLREDVRLTQTGSFIGSPAYMSPEALRGAKPDTRSDIWSFGVLLYEMLAGRRPFEGNQITPILISILEESVPEIRTMRPDVPPALDHLLQQILVKNPQHRIASMRQIAAELEAIRAGRPLPGISPQSNPAMASAVETAPPPVAVTPGTPQLNVAHNLPAQPTPFVGREQELVAIGRLLLEESACRLLTLLGPGGIGKTRLALAAAEKVSDAFPHGVYFVPLASISDPAFIISTMADALHFHLSGTATPKAQMLNYLSTKKMLLVTDNFEHLLDGAELLAEIVAAAPGITLLVTSRQRLNLQEEWVYEVQGLPFPQSDQEIEGKAAATLEAYSAVRLFHQRARRAEATFTLAAADLPHVARICQLVEGMPLGLELAAPWVRSMSCQEIAAEVARNLDILSTSMRNVPSRHRSLRAVFEQSWQQLETAEKSTLSRLSVFQGGCGREAAEQVTTASLLQLSALVDKALLRRTRNGRYQIHELVRQFAAEQLQTGERGSILDSHSAYYMAFLHRQTPLIKGGQQKEALAAIAADIDNVRAAWRRAVARREMQALADAAESLWLFHEFRGALAEGEAILRQSVTALAGTAGQEVAAGAETLVGFLLAGQGSLCARQGDFTKGQTLLKQGIALLRRPEKRDEQKEAFGLAWLSFALVMQGKYGEGTQVAQESLAFFPQTGDRWCQAGCLRLLGASALFEGKLEKAEQLLQQCLAVCSEIGERRIRTYATTNLGVIALARGDYGQAKRRLDEAYQISRELHDLPSQADLLREQGKVAIRQGMYAQARQDIEESLAIYKEIGRNDVGAALAYLATILRLQESYQAAQEVYQESLATSQAAGKRPGIAACLHGLGRLAYDQEAYEQAERHLLESLAIWQEIGNEPEMAALFCDLGHVTAASGQNRKPEAAQYFQRALQLAIHHRLVPVALDVFVGVAGALAQMGEGQKALELLSLVRHHANTPNETRQKAHHFRARLAAELPDDVVTTSTNRGQMLNWQTVASQIHAELSDPNWGRPRAAAHNLPTHTTPFIGREAELATLGELLAKPDVRLVTIVGFGGMGKTRLAIAAAQRISREQTSLFADGIVFVSLAGVETAAELPATLAKALQILLVGQTDPMTEVSNYLRHRKMLLILDNFEQLLDGAPLLNQLLSSAPDTRLLVTSREPLHLVTEWRFDLEGLSYPRQSLSSNGEQYEAVVLFAQMARQVQGDFQLTAEIAPHVHHLCRLVAGMPLAVKLAATWLRVMPCERIAAEVARNLDILTSRMRDLPPRQRSMRVIFEQTWALLMPEEQQAFQSLSVFRGGFSKEAARQVASVSPYLLAGLLDRGLVQFVDETRYEVHELTRQFAAEKLAGSEQATTIARRHSTYYLDFVVAQEAALLGNTPAVAIAALKGEIDNIRQAWQWAVANAQIELLNRTIETVAVFYELAGLLLEGEQVFTRAVAQLETEPLAGERAATVCHLLIRQIIFALNRSKTLSSWPSIKKAAELAEALQDESRLADVNLVRGFALRYTGDLDEAITYLQEAVEQYDALGHQRHLIWTLNLLGDAQERKQATGEGIASHQRALQIAQEVGNLHGQALSLSYIGSSYYFKDQYRAALSHFEQAVSLFEEAEDMLGIARTVANVGYISCLLGNYDQALYYINRAIPLFEQSGAWQEGAIAYDSLGQVYFEIGDYEQARQAYTHALQVVQESGQQLETAWVQSNLGLLDIAMGHYETAAAHLHRSLAFMEILDNLKEVAIANGYLGTLHWHQGQTAEAVAHFDRAIDGLRQTGGRYQLARFLVEKGELLLEGEQIQEAETLVKEGLEVAQEIGRKPVIFQAKLLLARLAHAHGRSPEAIRRLQNLLDETAEAAAAQAALYYELWCIGQERSHAHQALALYQQLSEQTPNVRYRQRLHELQAALAG